MGKKNGLRVKLSKNKYLVSDGLAYWIVREQKSKEGDTYDVRISGYCTSLETLFSSYFDRVVKDGTAETMEELTALIRKTRNEIRKWCKELKGE